MEVSKSAYYGYLKKDVGKERDQLVEAQVISIFRTHKRRYGSRRIVAELKSKDIVIGRQKVGSILNRYSLRAIQPKS